MDGYLHMNSLLLAQPYNLEDMKNVSGKKDSEGLDDSLQKASQDFESILINFVIKSMWNTIPKSGLFENSDNILGGYSEIMQSALAQDIAAKGGLGVSSIIYNQMKNSKHIAEIYKGPEIQIHNEKTDGFMKVVKNNSVNTE